MECLTVNDKSVIEQGSYKTDVERQLLFSKFTSKPKTAPDTTMVTIHWVMVRQHTFASNFCFT